LMVQGGSMWIRFRRLDHQLGLTLTRSSPPSTS
jgi:hypothetical protein